MIPMRLFGLARLCGRQRGGLLPLRVDVRRRVLPAAVPADRAGQRSRSAPGCGSLPWTATLFVFAPIGGALVNRVGERPLIVAGLLLQAIGFAWIALIAAPELAYVRLVAPLILAGAGVSMAMPAAQNAVLSAVAPAEIGKASGIFNMLRYLGGAFGIAIAGRGLRGDRQFRLGRGVQRGLRAGDRHRGGAVACWARSPDCGCRAATSRRRAGESLKPRNRRRRRSDMKVTRVQYTVRSEFVEENKQNIEAVMRELRALGNNDVRYAVYLHDDGKTFMHLVHQNTAEAEAAADVARTRSSTSRRGSRRISKSRRRWRRSRWWSRHADLLDFLALILSENRFHFSGSCAPKARTPGFRPAFCIPPRLKLVNSLRRVRP